MKIYYSWITTTQHKFWVVWYVLKACVCLIKRALLHDLSKYGDEEALSFNGIKRMREVVYGSEEYKSRLKELQPALRHHYNLNAHHPEFHKNGVNGMTAIDIIEMVCDWRAAVRRNKENTIQKSVKINKERYSMSEQEIEKILQIIEEIGL